MRLAPRVIVLALTAGPWSAVGAQDSTARGRLATWHGDLANAQEAPAVASLEAQWMPETSGNVRRLGLAFAGLRRFELGDSAALFPAWSDFSAVVAAEPQWPWARQGLGEAALALYRARANVPSKYDGGVRGTHFDGFVLQMDRILAREPTFQPALELATRVGVASGDRDERRKLARVLASAHAAARGDTDIELALAREDRLARRLDSATRRFEQYARWGGDPSLAQLELARTLAGQGRMDDAANAWFRGIATPSPLRRISYRTDLLWTASAEEIERFDALPDDSLPAFADAFWALRDAREIRRDGERLREHLRRWDYVYQKFRVPIPWRRTQFSQAFRTNLGYCLKDGPNTLDDLRPPDPSRIETGRGTERVLDHRALVYMRHGEPLRQVGGFQPSEAVNPSGGGWLPPAGGGLYAGWLYMIEGEPRVYLFEPDAALGLDAPRALILNKGPNLDLLLRFADDVPGYHKMAARRQIFQMTAEWGTGMALPWTCQDDVLKEIQELRNDAVVAMRTDTYQRRITKALDASLQAYAMGRAGQRPVAVVAFAIPAGKLKRDSAPTDPALAQVTVRFEAATLDSAAGKSARRDTTILYTLPTGFKKGFISGLLEVPIDTDANEVRAIILQGGDARGMLVSLPVALAPPVGLGMSDVIIGRASSQSWWHARDRQVMVSVSSRVAVDETLELYYELYGLEPGATYATTITLSRTGGDRAAASLAFEDQAVSETQGYTRRLALTGLQPGRYSLKVTVHSSNATGSVSRRQQLRVVW